MKEFLLGWYCGQALLGFLMLEYEEFTWAEIVLHTLRAPFVFLISFFRLTIDYLKKDS